MPGSVYHQLTATTPDDPAYEIRPSHFNQSHLVTINAAGSEISNAFSNANGLSFGLSAGAITGSYTVPSVPSVTEYFSKTNTTFNGANISGSITNNTDGFQLSLSVAPGGGAADGVNIIAAGTQTAATTGTVVFSNSNGITFGMSNNSVVTASHNALTTAMASNRGSDFVQATAAFAGTSASGTIASNGISVSIGPYITTAMLSNAATISNIRVSAGTTSNLLSALTFADANGLSFGLNASTVTASYTRPVVSNAIQSVGSATGSGTNTSRFAADDHVHAGVFSLGVSTAGNTSGDTRVDVGRFVLQGGNNVTLSQITAANALNTIVISGGAAGGADGVNVLVVNGGASTASTTLALSNSNNVTFGHNAGTITASASFAQTNQSAIRGFGVTNTGQTAGNTGISTGIDWVLAGSQSITLSQSTAGGGPNTVWIQHPAWLTTAMASNAATISNIRISAGTTSNLLSAFTFNDANGLSFGLNASTITGSYSRPVVSNAIASVGSATNSGTNTSRFAADDHVHAGVFSMGVSTGGNTAGDTRVDVGRFVLQGGNGITLSQVTAANALNTIVVSAGAGGAGDGGVFVGVSTGGNTLGSTGTVSTGNVVFVGTNGITLSQSTGAAGSAATITVSGFQRTNSGFDPYRQHDYTVASFGHGSLHLNGVDCMNFQCDRIVLAVNNTNSSNSSGSHTLSFDIGLYTRTSNSLSRLVSTSGSRAATHSGTAGSYSLLSGIRLITIPFTTTITEGQYWIAFLSRTASGGANGSYSQRVVDQLGSNISGHFGSSNHATLQYPIGRGFYSASTAALPQSIAFSEITGSGSLAQRVPWVVFGATTY